MERLETQRLLLRPYTEADASAVYDYCSDPRIGPAAGWPPHEDVADSLRVIRTIFMPTGSLAVIWKQTGAVIGGVGLVGKHQPDLGLPSEELGYSLSRPYWGQGIIPEAVQAVIGQLLKEGYAAIWACYYDGNHKSRRVMEKCGLTYRFSRMDELPQVGETRLAHYYAVAKEEWRV